MPATHRRSFARVVLAALGFAAACASAPPPVAAAHEEAPKASPVHDPSLPPPPPERCPSLPVESTAHIAEIDASLPLEAQPKLRLPDDVRPTHQALSLSIDPAQPRFTGSTAIAVQLDHPRSTIWLHGRGLHVTEVHLDLQGARLPAEYTQVTDGGLVRVKLPCAVSGRALLALTWDAAFDPNLAGLYIARENDVPYAYSQFEAIDARRAFPGFDEPVFKIPWDVELVVPAGDVAVSNGAIVNEGASEGGQRRIRFSTTPPLPTYLLAFAVGPFDVVVPPPLPPDDVRDHPLQLRGIAPRGRGPELEFAMRASAALMHLLEHWFGIAYPYEKLDQIAVPDFQYGAMENAGAITYREDALLFAKGVTGRAGELNIAIDLAHEMAHQWFGDLVTLRWWTDAWLNESFAAWMETKMVDAWRPDLRGANEHARAVDGAMVADATATARAIRKPVEDEASIWNQFDDLTYSKGAGLLSMIESWLGPEVFRAGIQKYLRAHANGGGSSDDLFAALSEAAGKDVAGPMRTFLEQPGVPLVQVKVACSGRVHVTFQQSRDLPAGTPITDAIKAQRWQFPICVRAGVRGEIRSACIMLTEEKGDLELPGTRCPDWLMPNSGGVGYFRFALEPKELQALTAAHAQLTPMERAALAGNLVDAYTTSAEPAAEVVRALSLFVHDREPEVSQALTRVLTDAAEKMLPASQLPALEAYGRTVYGPLAEKLGWTAQDDDSPSLKSEREQVLRFLTGTARDPQLRAQGARLGRAYANANGESFDKGAISPDLAGMVLGLAVQEGKPELREKLVARLTNSSESAVRRRILGALGSLRDPALTPELLKLTFDPQLHKNERLSVLFAQLSHKETRSVALAWFVEHWDAVAAQTSQESMAGMLGVVASLACDAKSLHEIDGLVREKQVKFPNATLEVEQGLEESRLCIARRATQGKSLAGFFSKTQTK